jgi:hypothetical protein
MTGYQRVEKGQGPSPVKGLMAGGAISRRATGTAGGAAGADEALAPFKSEFGELFFDMFRLAYGATDLFRRFENKGFKILATIETGIFEDGHNLFSFLRNFLKGNHSPPVFQPEGGRPSKTAAANKGSISS